MYDESVQKSYGIENLSYRDESRKSDYLLTRTSGSSTFHMPVDMDECGFIYPSELTELICTDALPEREQDKYTQQEIDKKVEDLKYDVEEYIKDAQITFKDKGSDIDPDMKILNAEHLFASMVNNE